MGQDSYFDHPPSLYIPAAPGRPGPRCEPGLQRSVVGETTHLHCLEHPVAGSRDDRVVTRKETIEAMNKDWL